MTLETAGARKTIEQSLTLAIQSLFIQTSIHENKHAITIYMSMQVKVMNLIQPTLRPTRIGSINRHIGTVLVVCQSLHQPTCWPTCWWDWTSHFYHLMQNKFLSNSIKAFLK